MTATFFDHLSKDFTELLFDQEDCNVIIEVGEPRNRKIFWAHSAVLRYRSPHFRRELMNADRDRKNVRRIIKENVSENIFKIILRYIYGGLVKFDDMDNSALLDLTAKSNEFELREMASYLETHLVENETDWLRSHFSTVCNAIYNCPDLVKLKKFCNDFIVRSPHLIFHSEDFNRLQESSLVSLLKRDDLQMEEAHIWDKVIQWGCANTPNLSANHENWTAKDFRALKTTLQRCTPHVRYFQLSVEDVFDRIMPYKKILERTVWRDLAVHLADPERPIETVMLPPRRISTPQEPQSSSSSSRPYALQSSSRSSSQFPQPYASQSSSQFPSSQFPRSYASQSSSQFPQLYASQPLSQFPSSPPSQSYNSQLYEPRLSSSRSPSPSPHPYESQSFNSQPPATKSFASQPSASRSSSTHPFASLQPYASQLYMSQSTLSSQSSGSRSSTPHSFTKIKPAEDQLSSKELMGNENCSETQLNGKGKLSEGKVHILDEKSSEEKLFILDEEEEEQLFLLGTTEEKRPIREKGKERPLNASSEMEPLEMEPLEMEPFSMMITEDHVVEISSWIDQKEDRYDATSNPYEFKLLARGSRDGFDPKTFWEMCDGHAGTVVVLKVKDTDEILGGYNPVAWDKDSPNRKIETIESFIFSLKNGNSSKSILSRVKSKDSALWYYPHHREGGYGPWFGNGNLGMKTSCSNFSKDARCCANSYSKWYELPIRASDDWFSIDEYEVFLVSGSTRTSSLLE